MHKYYMKMYNGGMNYAEVHNEKAGISGSGACGCIISGIPAALHDARDPVRMMLGESATPEAQAELRLELGLDDPFLVQYGRYIKISWYIRIWERPTLPEDLSWMRL